MFMCPLPPGDGFLVFCDRTCVDVWADDDPDDDLVRQAVGVGQGQGPPWCLHCHACAERCWTSRHCPMCPDCADGRWSITAAAEAFARELGRYPATVPPPDAYERGRLMCSYGLTPTFAAQIVLDLHRR